MYVIKNNSFNLHFKYYFYYKKLILKPYFNKYIIFLTNKLSYVIFNLFVILL